MAFFAQRSTFTRLSLPPTTFELQANSNNRIIKRTLKSQHNLPFPLSEHLALSAFYSDSFPSPTLLAILTSYSSRLVFPPGLLRMSSLDSYSTLVLGCTVGVFSLATQSLGLSLQRRSHTNEPGKPAWRRPLWRIGLLLFLLSNVVGSTVQITTLPLVILAPLQAVGLVFNSVCSSVVLSEPFTVYALAGTVLVAIGALFIAYWGVVPEPHHNLAQLLVLLSRKPFLAWMGATGMVVLGIMVMLRVSRKWTPNPICPKRLPLLRGMLYGVICGILSAHSLLMAKSAVEIMICGLSNHFRDFYHYQTWLIVLSFLFFAVSQLCFLNNALHLCSTSVIFPLNFCVYNIVTIVNGIIYFEQTANLSATSYAMIAVGAGLILVGVACLSWRLGLSDLRTGEICEIEYSFTNDGAKPESLHAEGLASTETQFYEHDDESSTLTDAIETSALLRNNTSPSGYHSFESQPKTLNEASEFKGPMSPFSRTRLDKNSSQLILV